MHDMAKNARNKQAALENTLNSHFEFEYFNQVKNVN